MDFCVYALGFSRQIQSNLVLGVSVCVEIIRLRIICLTLNFMVPGKIVMHFLYQSSLENLMLLLFSLSPLCVV